MGMAPKIPGKPRLTPRLIAAELDSVADSVRRMSLKNSEAALERLAAVLNGGGHG